MREPVLEHPTVLIHNHTVISVTLLGISGQLEFLSRLLLLLAILSSEPAWFRDHHSNITMASIKKTPPKSWTNVTSDAELVKHLLELYICWEYPILASLNKEHFQQDFNSGSSRYCSPLLVNALLALGSRFSDRPEARADPNDPFTAGDAFFEEAKRLFWEQTDHQDLTAVQAIGIMSIREASCGRDVDSRYFAGQSVRLAIEMGLHRLDDDGGGDDYRTGQLITLWGAFSLDQYVFICPGSLSL